MGQRAGTMVGVVLLASTVTGALALAQSRGPAKQGTSQGGQPSAVTPDGHAAPPRTAVVPNDPQRTTATFGDWTLRCERLSNDQRVCEAATAIMATAQGQSGPIAQVAIGRPVPHEPLRITLVLPANVGLGSPPRLAAGETARALAELSWRRCLPGACYADTAIDDAALNELKARQEPARLSYRDGAEREIALSLSTRGLAQSLEALSKEGSDAAGPLSRP